MRATAMKLWAVIGAVALVASGCSCGGETQCADLFVSFESPKTGETVPAITDVVVSVADKDGVAVELERTTICTRLVTSSECSVPREGTFASGKVTFKDVTLEQGENFVKVVTTKKGTTCSATKSITLTVVNPVSPKVVSVAFPQDLSGDKVLNAAEFPSGTDLKLDVVTQGVVGGTIEVSDQSAPGTVLGTANVSGSMATVSIPASALSEKGYVFTVKAINSAKTANDTAMATITIARTPPTCAVTLPTKAIIGPNDDADGVKTGFQLRTSATASSSATTIEIKLTGGAAAQTSGAVAPALGGLSHDFDILTSGTVAYTLTVEAKDVNGNVCTKTGAVTADFDAPTLTIISPDGGTETSNNVPLVATVVGGNGGFVTWTYPADAGTQTINASVDGGVVSSAATFLNGAHTITAVPTDAVGNVGASVVRPFTVNAAAACAIVFTKPATRPGFITASAAPGGNYSFQATSTCAQGTAATLKRDGTIIGTQNVDASGLVIWTVPVTSGTFLFRTEVGVSFDEITVTVDLSTPAITVPLNNAVLNIASDVAPGITGIQSNFAYMGTFPIGSHADVCSNQTPAPGGSTACADGSSGYWTLKSNETSPDATFTFPNGSYCLKVVIVNGTTTNASTPVCILVDGIAPTLSGLTLLRDADSNNKLNIAELNGLPPEYQFTLGGGHSMADITRIQVKEGTTVFNTTGAVVFSGTSLNIVNVKLDQNITTTTLTYNWTIEMQDTAGNIGTSTVQVVKIDKVAPTCTIVAPTQTLLGKPADAVSGTPGFDIQVDVNSSSDAATVNFGVAGGETLSFLGTASTGTASHTFALTQTTGVLTYNFTAVCADDSGNTANAAPFNGVSVDLDPPTCVITAPVASPPQYSSLSLATSVDVGGPGTVGRMVTVFSQVGAGTPAQVGTLVVSGSGTASGSVSYNNGPQTLTAQVSDPAGNVCTTAPVAIDINSAGCAIAFTSPTIGSSGKAFLTTTSFSVTGVSSNCGAGKTVTLFQVGNATPLGTGTTVGTAPSTVSINGTLAEGGPYTLRLRIDNGASLTTDSDLTPVYVDATAPTATSVEFNTAIYPLASTAITFVSVNNTNRVPAPNPTYVQDNVAGGNADFNMKVNAVTAATGGRVRVVYQTVEIASANVTASPQDVTLSGVSLTQNTSGTFQVEVIDEAGNVLRPINVPGVVDVQEPGAPVVTQTVTNVRAATVNLSWSPTYDDGTTLASGAHQGYEIRWSTSTVTGNNGLALYSDYLDSAKAHAESNQAWSGSASSRDLTLPPFNTYYIVVRALDEVGNFSAYAAPTPKDNLGTTNILTNPAGATTNYAVGIAAAGSLNGDALDDLAVSSSGNAKVHLYFGQGPLTDGGSGFIDQPACPSATCQTVDIPVARSPSTESFGTSVAVGRVTDATNPQLVVGSQTYDGGQGRAFLYFAGVNPDAGSYVDETAYVQLTGEGGTFGSHVAVLPDINGDGLGEVAITARAFNSNRGRVYVYKGRSKLLWQGAADAGPISSALADWIIEGPVPVPATGNNFGPRLSMSSIGKLTGGNGNDFTLAAAHENTNTLYLLSSAVMGDGGIITTGFADAGVPSMAFQTLSDAPPGGSVFSAYGSVVVGNVDVTGATARDLIVANPRKALVYVYGDGTPATFGSPVVTINGFFSSFGTSLVTSDINSDGHPDIVSGESAASGVASHAWVLYNRTNSYDPNVGLFYQSVFTGTSTASGAFGTRLATGDFDGDGKADIAIVDPSIFPGRVLIWR